VADISDKHDTEQEARRRADLQGAAALAALPVGVAVYGRTASFILVNEAYNRLYADSPVTPGENLRDILLRAALAGETARATGSRGRDAASPGCGSPRCSSARCPTAA
jgi:hypothetical protein